MRLSPRPAIFGLTLLLAILIVPATEAGYTDDQCRNVFSPEVCFAVDAAEDTCTIAIQESFCHVQDWCRRLPSTDDACMLYDTLIEPCTKFYDICLPPS